MGRSLRSLDEVRADIAVCRASGAYFRQREAAGARLLRDIEELIKIGAWPQPEPASAERGDQRVRCTLVDCDRYSGHPGRCAERCRVTSGCIEAQRHRGRCTDGIYLRNWGWVASPAERIAAAAVLDEVQPNG